MLNPGDKVKLGPVELPDNYPDFMKTVKIAMRIPLVRPGVYETDWWIVKLWKAYGPRWFWAWRYNKLESKRIARERMEA